MKKLLIASTALVATAGMAAAEIELKGVGVAGLKYNDGAANEELTAHVDYTLTVAMSGETDGGLTFGIDLTITGDESATGAFGNLIAYVEGGFGKISAGNVGSAVDATLGLGDIGFDGLSTDNVAEAQIDANDQGTLMYKGTFGDFGVAASYNMAVTDAAPAGNEFSIAATYSMGDYGIGLGYDDMNSAITAKLSANVANIALAGLVTTSDLGESYGVTAAYTMGATTVTAAYSKDESGAGGAVDLGEAYGIGVAYDLGGGAAIKGAIGENASGNTVADLGITMSF